MTDHPPISPATAMALCVDAYTGRPAEDDPAWQGAGPESRAAEWTDMADGSLWCFCARENAVEAINEDGAGFFAYVEDGEWAAY